MPQTYTGKYRFPGTYAFLEKYNIADYALLQFNDPFTGLFDETAAEDTCETLLRYRQDKDDAVLHGQIITCDVNGRSTPVLFLFD